MVGLVLYDERFLEHSAGPGHPERPARLRAALLGVERAGSGAIVRRPGRAATSEELLRVHDAAHVDRLLALAGHTARLDPDTAVSPGSVDAALLAAGACIELVEQVASGRVQNGFALVRPPGHHAEPSRSMGFCLFDNIAVAAAHARATLGVRRVLIVDWDVHHGNGTQAAFYERDDVALFDSHQAPYYPGTGAATERGAGRGLGTTLNVPLPAGCGDADYLHVYRELLLPFADRLRPDLVLVSAGFDAHVCDPLASMAVTSAGFGALCSLAVEVAERHAGGRIALILEGGYDLTAITESVAACTTVLAGHAHTTHERQPSRGIVELVDTLLPAAYA
jgi:acetoin utilization deacetylase AcuC-like enzyme